jgi:hypothetical protein
MPATPITNPVSGESLLGTEPQLLQQVDPGWRRRLNLFTGRALSDTALDNEQLYRSGLLATLGQSVTAGTVMGLALTMDTSGPDPMLFVSPGYGIAANGEDVVLNRPLKTALSTLTVIDSTGKDQLSFHQFVTDPGNTTYAGILILQPVVAQVSGQSVDTGTGPIEVTGDLDASCDQDPEEYVFEDWQIADGVRLVFFPWPTGATALALPPINPELTWRNRLAYAIFEAESLLGPDDQLPWAMLGVPVALIAFDPGIAWQANKAFTIGQFMTDSNGNIQQVQTAGTSGATHPASWNTAYGGTTTDGSITWVNNDFAWKPLFVDCSSVVRAGGLPRMRYVLPSKPPQLAQWQSKTPFALGNFIIDPHGNVQVVQTAGTTGGPPPAWSTTVNQTTTDGTIAWVNNGPARWQPNTAFAAGKFLYDSKGNIQTVLTAGSSGSAEPDWNGVYLPTSDGTITWINNGSGNPPVIQTALAQARINQLSEQLSQVMSQHVKFNILADIFPTLPPSGILPAPALDFAKNTAPWFPPNWSLSAGPVHLEELETVLETGMLEALVAAQTSAPTDPKLLEPIEVLIPLPDAVYDPNILVTETVALIFQQEVDQATHTRNLDLQRLQTVQQELNTLLAVLGPNVPANPNLIDPNAGLTPDEIQGRNTPPPYTPASTETFGTLLQSTWLPSEAYSAGAFVIDGNGRLQIVKTAGTSGTASPTWNTETGETTTDGTVTWLNNGPWAWQPNTAYISGQFVVDSKGFMQVVSTGGTSASAAPKWNETPGQNTSDGIIWQAGGNAAWQPDNLYAVGQLILDSNHNIQIVQTGGISGDSAPATWNQSPGQTTQDSGVIWNNLGHASWQPNTAFKAGQAIIDSNGNIQLVQVGGTSGASLPTSGASPPTTWNEGANATTLDASITWTNSRTLTWQQNTAYTVNQIVLDSNGNLQLVQTAETSGSKAPAWNRTPAASTSDGTVTWVYLSFHSTDLVQLQAAARQAPYTNTFKDFTGTSHTIQLISANDLANLNNYGLQYLITSLNARISQANDLLDTAFLTAQTDIYRYRQNVLGSTAATALATSPVLANIATGETATATAADLQNYISTVIPPPGSTTPAPVFKKPILRPIPTPVVRFSSPTVPSTAALKPAVQSAILRTQAVAANLTALKATVTTPESGATITAQERITPESVTLIPKTSPAQVITPTETAGASPTDITNQSPIVGAQLNIRTLTIGERLAQSPSQEAMFYSIANRLNFLQVLQTLENDLELAADDLPFLVDAQVAQVSATSLLAAPGAVPVETHTFSEWLDSNSQPGLLDKIQSPYLIADASEATLFSVGIRVTEQHTMLLRALEARVQQYVDFVGLCTAAFNNIQSNVQQANVYLTRLQNALFQDRQSVAFTTALLNDETRRVNNVNAQRQQILQNSVQLIAYTRARTLEATDTTPSRQLVPSNVANLVPSCLQQSVAVPPELREIVSLLREAPVGWLPAAASQVNNLERPILLQQLALSTQARAAQQVQVALLPSSAAGEPGVYAATISNVYSADQQVFRNLQVQRANFQPAALTNLSWSSQVATVQSIAAVNDLISADSIHSEITNAVSQLIQDISSVATCLYTRVGIALPVDRLAWAEYLQSAGLSVQLQSLAFLPNWNQLAYVDRQQMQLLVDWLFQQIDTSNSAATAFMSDVVRTAILLASDVPVDNIIPGNIILRTQPAVGGVVSLNLPSERISSGMYVNLYSGATLAARAVVSDLDTHTVSATVTEVFTPGAYLETSDIAHFTAQTPQAVALRPFFMQS